MHLFLTDEQLARRIYEGTSEIQHIVIARQLLREFEGPAQDRPVRGGDL
jgi:alkylation response protein AidB-like acyl-CoA dehydrogenase